MKRINIEKNIRPISEFRTNASEILEYINNQREPIVITQNGRSAGVILSVADYEEIMVQQDILNAIELAHKESETGVTIPHQEVMKNLKAKLIS